jgi:hypothetical protein
VAEHVKNIIDREMSMMALIRTNSSKQRYQIDESKGEVNPSGDEDYNDDTMV